MSPYWSVEQEQALIDLLDSKTPLEDIAKQLHRSVDAVVLKAKRMGVNIPEKCLVKSAKNKVTKSEATTTTLPAFKPAQELISLEEAMKLLVGGLQQLQNPGLTNLEIKRFRSIVSGARTYMSMLERYEKWTSIEQGIVDMEARWLERYKQDLQIEKDPAKRARLKKEIESLESSLQQSAKHYAPFKKKPSLTSPF